MHLNRAVDDLRRIVESDPTQTKAWEMLREVVEQRHGTRAGELVADAAACLAVPGFSPLPLSTSPRKVTLTDPLVASFSPPVLSAPLRKAIQLLQPAFEKMLPFDRRSWHATRPTKHDSAFFDPLEEAAATLGVETPRLLLTDISSRVCVPVMGNPTTIVVGRHLPRWVDRSELLFLFVRAIAISECGLSAAMRAQPGQFELIFASALNAFDSETAREMVEVEKLQRVTTQLAKCIPRNRWDDLGSLLLELYGRPDFLPGALPLASAELGNRIALHVTARVVPAINAMITLSGKSHAESENQARIHLIRSIPECSSLLSFAISDEMFSAQTQNVEVERP